MIAQPDDGIAGQDAAADGAAKRRWPQDILLDLDVASKQQLFETLGQFMEREHGLRRDWVVNGLDRRERAGSTAIGEGVAIPHARVAELDHIRIAYVRLKSAIAFDAPDGKPVIDVLVLLVPKQATEEHLRILAEVSQMFSDADLRRRLHACAAAEEVRTLFKVS